MDQQPSPELLAAAEAETPREDRLDVIRAKVARVRDLRLQVQDLQEQVTAANKEINDLQFRDLPDLFSIARIRVIGLEASGNLPAYDAAVKPFYKAGISAEWEDHRREEGFAVLQDLGGEGLIKSVVTIELDRGDIDKLALLTSQLDQIFAAYDELQSVSYKVGMAVHWGTLTKWLRERYEAKPKRELTPGQLEKIGGTATVIVEVKPRKD
jgi:hypothetical protein